MRKWKIEADQDHAKEQLAAVEVVAATAEVRTHISYQAPAITQLSLKPLYTVDLV